MELIYKELSISSGTGVAIWSKTMGLLATITLKVVYFCAYAWFSALLPFFKCILELVFWTVFSTNRVKMVTFKFYLQSGEQRKVGWVGDKSHVVLVKNSLVKKEV
jgi:hypothetical protein